MSHHSTEPRANKARLDERGAALFAMLSVTLTRHAVSTRTPAPAVPALERSAEIMMALAILFGFSILMNGSTFAAIQGRFAQKLELPGSVVIPYIPWIALAGYVAAVWALRAVKRTRTRWIGFIIVTVIANTVIGYPILLLDHGSTCIPVKDLISRESRAAFEARYPVKFVSYSASREGACIRVRKDQYSEEMASYVADLIKKQD